VVEIGTAVQLKILERVVCPAPSSVMKLMWVARLRTGTSAIDNGE